MALGQQVSFSCMELSLKTENIYVCNPLSGDSRRCVSGADQGNAQQSGQEAWSWTGSWLCTANLQCWNSRNS